MAISKFVLIGSGAGLATATAAGVVVYLNSGESIKDHIASKLGANFKFISLVSEAEQSLVSKYEKSTINKPTKNNAEIKKDQIVGWCKEVEDVKFSGETEPTYLSVKSWCFVNTNTLSAQARQSNKSSIKGADGSAEDWKKAWEAYRDGKSDSKLEITWNDIGVLNTGERNSGGLAMYDWCKKQNDRKMYEADAEDIYKRYEKWCFEKDK